MRLLSSSEIEREREDITRWLQDMNFIFEWQNTILLTRYARP